MEHQRERIREIQLEMAKKVTEERSKADRRYNYQVDQLGGDLTSQWEQTTKLQLELERVKRNEQDQKREIVSKTNLIEDLKAEIKMINSSHLTDLAHINAEKHSLEQEITALR